MRILHAPSNIADQPWTVAEALRARGHQTEVWHYGPNPYGFSADRFVPWPAEPRVIWDRIVDAASRFDVVHFHFGRSLVPRALEGIPALWDLPVLRALGVSVFVTFAGSDVRLPSVERARTRWALPVEADEDAIRKRLEIWRTFADGLFVSSPTSLAHVPEASIHARAVPLDALPFRERPARERPLVVHAPSNRATKGTEHVLAAVERLRGDGVALDFELLEEAGHDRVLDAFARADVVIDQVLVGDYGVAGIEAMALGAVVMVRTDPEVERALGPVPVVQADPDSLADALRGILADPTRRSALAREARTFVERHHAPAAVAAALEQAYRTVRRPVLGGHPDWASLGEARKLERVEQQLVAAQTALESSGRTVILPGLRRGPFAALGTKIDERLRALSRRRR